MILFFLFILGLLVGSFLNVVIFRLHRSESFLTGRSKCLFCGHKLKPLDLVPLVSFLALWGKCRYCKHQFSSQYFWVELITGLVFVLIYQSAWPDYFQILTWLIAACFLIIIFVYDLKYYLILDKVILPAIILVFVANILLGFDPGNLFLAMLLGGGFFWLQYVMSHGRWIGGGDIRLGAFLGALLGWPQVVTALFIAYVGGSLVSVALLIWQHKGLKDKVPFGTFLTVGAFLAMLYGDRLVDWYWALFGL